MTDFTQDLFSRRRNASDGNTRVVSAGKLWYDSVTNTFRVSDGHTPGGQIVTGQSGSYTLPTATPSVKGGVQLGANIVASGATIDVLSPTRVSQLENDSNYLSGAVLATYATQSYVTSQGYITSAALVSGNANVTAANSRISSLDANIGAYQIWANANVTTLSSNAGTQATSINRLDANIGAYQTWANGRITTLDGNLGTATTNISNLVTQANANTTALLTGSVTTGPLTVDSTSGGYFANISAWGRPQNGRQSWRFYVNNGIGGPASFLSFPDSTNQFTAYTGTATTLSDIDANIGTLYLGDISTQANLGTLFLGNTATNANLGAFQTYANTKIGTNSNGNLVVVATTASTSTTTGALVVRGGAGIAGAVNIGTSLSVDGGVYGNVTTTQYGSLFAYAYGPNPYSILQAWSLGTQGMGINAYGTELYSSGAITFKTGATVRDKDYPTGGTSGVKIAANGAVIALTGITSTSTATGALIVTGGAGVSGNLNVGNYANLYMSSGTVNNQAALNLVGNVTGKSGAGAGYHDFMMVQSTNSAISNGQKWFRINQAGGLEIVNSGFTTTLFRLEDNGDLIISGNVTQSGIRPGYSSARPGFRVIGGGTTNNLTTTQNTYGALNSNNFTVDFNQGSYLNTSTGVFTAPVAGLYQVNIVGRNAGNLTSISQLAVTKNGTSGGLVGGTVLIMIEFAANSSMNHTGGGTVTSLAVGDTLALKVLAGTINFDSNDNWSVAYIG